MLCLLPVFIEFSRFCGTYQSAKFELDNLKVFDVAYEDMKANKKKLQSGDAYYIKDNSVIKLKLKNNK